MVGDFTYISWIQALQACDVARDAGSFIQHALHGKHQPGAVLGGWGYKDHPWSKDDQFSEKDTWTLM